jgi:hypothetical protein
MMAFGDSYTKQPDSTYTVGFLIQNNQTDTLYRVHVEVSYLMSSGEWTTFPAVNMGLIDITEQKHTTASLIDPLLSSCEVQKYDRDYDSPGNLRNVTIPTMAYDNLRVIAYGYKTP